MNIAYIICQNDWQHAVVLDDEARAETELERYAKAEYDRVGRWGDGSGERSYTKYRYLVRWHVRKVPVI